MCHKICCRDNVDIMVVEGDILIPGMFFLIISTITCTH